MNLDTVESKTKQFVSRIVENILFKFVSMGNPHAVGFVKNISEIDISQIGPKIEQDSHFPNKINVEFVRDHFR